MLLRKFYLIVSYICVAQILAAHSRQIYVKTSTIVDGKHIRILRQIRMFGDLIPGDFDEKIWPGLGSQSSIPADPENNLPNVTESQSSMPADSENNLPNITESSGFKNSDGPDQFIQVGSKYYYFEGEKKMNWFDAADECRLKNSQLVSIEDETEQELIKKYLIENLTRDWYWTSGNDLGKEGEFKWAGTGKPFEYAVWGEGQPNHLHGNQRCVNLFIPWGLIFFLNDEICSTERYFICEYPSDE